MSNSNLLTKQGHAKLVEQLDQLKDKQNRLITQLEEVAQPDESGEDYLAVQLKEELEVLNDKIDKIETVLATAKIITDTNHDHDKVEVGCKVKIKISQTSQQYHIVNHLEADPTQNKISDQSPLGQALLNGGEVDFKAPVGRLTYKIVAID